MTNDPDTTIPAPLSTYKQASVGTISQFESVTLVNDSTLGESDSSATAVQNVITNVVQDGIIPELKTCVELIQNHITNYNNPHKDTFSSISATSSTEGNISNIFNRIINGTVPQAPPTISLCASYDVVSPFLLVNCQRASELWYVDAQGHLNSLPENQIRADYSSGKPMYLCWPAVTQSITNLDLMENSDFEFSGGMITNSYNNNIAPNLDSTQVTLQENATFSKRSLSLSQQNVLTVGKDNTFSIFVYPGYSSGSIFLIFNKNVYAIDIVNPTTQYTFSLDGSTTDSVGLISQLPNQWWRVGLSISPETEDATIEVGFVKNRYATLEDAQHAFISGISPYMGVKGTNAISFAVPQLTNISGLAPVIKSGSLSATTLTYPGLTDPVALSYFMGRAEFILYESLNSNTVYNVIQMGEGYQITHNDNSLTYYLEGHQQALTFTDSISNGCAYSASISYAPDSVSMLTSNWETRQFVTDFIANPATSLPAISNFTIGPFRGGICNAEYYSVSDNCNALSLINQI